MSNTYHVAADGSDLNSGTSASEPWQTVARVNAQLLNPGDRVLFHAGQSFGDATLMPSAGGTQDAPILLGAYSTGARPVLPQGVWFVGKDHLAFSRLALGPDQGIQGGNSDHPASGVTVDSCLVDFAAQPASERVGINAFGAGWTITRNVVQNIGNSGMLLEGDDYWIAGNTIKHTGYLATITYGKHGIYLRVSNAKVSDNTIHDFSSDGISARYRNSIIVGNRISGGAIGIGWFQYDELAGKSYWLANEISTETAGIYVSGSDKAGPTVESFVLSNPITRPTDAISNWQDMNLYPTTGTYELL